MKTNSNNFLNKTKGILLGTAVGDAIGLPMEGMSSKRIKRLKWMEDPDTVRHHFFLGKGMWSDDTEHTIMLTQALLTSDGDVVRFRKSLGWELRWWLWGLPAGVGMATARAIFKLWLGFPTTRSGVFSAGNGATMRCAIIASYFPDQAEKRKEFTIAQTRLTHSDPKASIGAMAVTEVTAYMLQHDTLPSSEKILSILNEASDIDLNTSRGYSEAKDQWLEIIKLMEQCWSEKKTTKEFLTSLYQPIKRCPKKGVTGYVYHSAPIAIYAGVLDGWDFRKVIHSIVSLGGDTDTVAAIAGAMCGAAHGTENIPSLWIKNIKEWPCSTSDLTQLAEAVTTKSKLRVRARWSPFLIIRNIFFLIIVLLHGFSRLIPRTSR